MTSVEKFNQLLKQELTLVQVYTQVLTRMEAISCFNQLVENLHCHQTRADLLAGEVRQLKGKPGWLLKAPRIRTHGPFGRTETLNILASYEDAACLSYDNLL